eukprot:7895020-Lingulodinium_polyedra.AAC.1
MARPGRPCGDRSQLSRPKGLWMPMCAGAATRVPGDVQSLLVRPPPGSEVSVASEAAACHPRATVLL